MYKELINRLREIHPEEFGDAWDFAFACQQTMCEAADAIEELICEVADEHNARIDVEERHRWIPVTERLPKDKKETYWCYTDAGAMCECRWTNDRYGLGASYNWGWNVMDVPQYQKITHWMPLPEPPKEET